MTPAERKVAELAEECTMRSFNEERVDTAAFYSGYAKGLLQALKLLAHPENNPQNTP